MSKGFFMQGVAVLFRQEQSLETIQDRLSDYQIVKQLPASKDSFLSGPSLIVGYRPEVNGYVSVDIVGSPWPDHMGHPQKEPMLFSAWCTGHYGPYAYPNGLRRACEQSWRWSGAKEFAAQHSTFLRLRISYIFGSSDHASVAPADYNPEEELRFLAAMSSCILRNDDTGCYFNPNGEVLLSGTLLENSLKFAADHDLPPLDVWGNIRMFKMPDGWLLMDSVGNWQLDITDHEVAFPKGEFSPQEVDNFIRNASAYILGNGDVIKDGDTMNGPGGISWQAKRFEKGLSDPPREVLRWLPCGKTKIPSVFLSNAS